MILFPGFKKKKNPGEANKGMPDVEIPKAKKPENRIEQSSISNH